MQLGFLTRFLCDWWSSAVAALAAAARQPSRYWPLAAPKLTVIAK
jgi:hypothetical protein